MRIEIGDNLHGVIFYLMLLSFMAVLALSGVSLDVKEEEKHGMTCPKCGYEFVASEKQ